MADNNNFLYFCKIISKKFKILNEKNCLRFMTTRLVRPLNTI